MKKKIVSSLILLLLISFFVGIVNVYASDVEEIISSMSEASTPDGSDSGIGDSIRDVIGLLQIAGTGIALVVVTMLGIKYMIASPSEKADTKKQIMPILIGCILLFGAVTIVSAITEFSAVIEQNTK